MKINEIKASGASVVETGNESKTGGASYRANFRPQRIGLIPALVPSDYPGTESLPDRLQFRIQIKGGLP